MGKDQLSYMRDCTIHLLVAVVASQPCHAMSSLFAIANEPNSIFFQWNLSLGSLLLPCCSRFCPLRNQIVTCSATPAYTGKELIRNPETLEMLVDAAGETEGAEKEEVVGDKDEEIEDAEGTV